MVKTGRLKTLLNEADGILYTRFWPWAGRLIPVDALILLVL